MKLLILDGNSIINRAFYGIRLLTTKDGFHTNGIYGFMNILFKLKDDTKPDAVAVAFDLNKPTFRHLEYENYKAGRKGMPEELAMQMPVLKELLTYLGVPVLEKEGYEADDILGTVAEQAKAQRIECVIATGDRDSLQLVGDGVTVYLASTKMGRPEITVYDEAKIQEEYRVSPAELIDVKALMGDASDKIPGVAGIGSKTALDLIEKYHSIDHIYENIDTLAIKDSVKNKLVTGKDSAYLSKKLGTIYTAVPLETEISVLGNNREDEEGLFRLLTRLEFFKMIEKLGLNGEAISLFTMMPEEKTVMIEQDIHKAIAAIQKAGQADILCEYEAGNIKAASFVSDGIQYLITSGVTKLFTAGVFRTDDAKKLYTALAQDGILPEITFDASLAGYLLHPDQNDYSVERLAAFYHIPPGSVTEQEYSDLLQKAKYFSSLCDRITDEIEKNHQTSLLKEIELPLAKVLFSMEQAGFQVDKEGITKFGDTLSVRIQEIEQEIYGIIGYQFNLNSPKQLGEALFVKLGLPHGKKTKTGYSTGVEVLESLKYDSEAVMLILEYRTLAKLKSTYCDGLLKVIGPDGRIHTTFRQTEARTGRISSTEPNLQNIPVRQDLGRELRKFFVAGEGNVLCDADYSQIELRVLAHIADDKAMIEAFNQNTDIHTLTASQVFNVPVERMTSLLRSRAKAVNFGIVYGISAFSLSKDIGVTRSEADEYIHKYFETYRSVKEYMDNCIQAAKETGYVTTIFGRRRYLPELSSSNFNLRSFGERVARNMPIQGTAADIIKIAMVKVFERLKAEGLRARLILQVHDELIVEAPEEEREKAERILKEEMENAARLSVKMSAEVKTGKTWYEAK